jgi:hypothetical protein
VFKRKNTKRILSCPDASVRAGYKKSHITAASPAVRTGLILRLADRTLSSTGYPANENDNAALLHYFYFGALPSNNKLLLIQPQNKKATLLRGLSFSFAVRTGLEPATLGVTGRYSNQLNYRTISNILADI